MGEPGSAGEEALGLFVRAVHFAAGRHVAQRRKNGDIPYVNHPIRVAHVLWEVAGVRDGATLAAAILHDTVEDTDATAAELEEVFGAEVAGLVAEVTDDKSLPKTERKRQQVEHARHLSEKARQVKLADKIDNLRDLASKPPPNWGWQRVAGYFAWAHAVVEPMRREGCGLTAELERLFAVPITVGGQGFRAVPEEPAEREKVLAEYYLRLEGGR